MALPSPSQRFNNALSPWISPQIDDSDSEATSPQWSNLRHSISTIVAKAHSHSNDEHAASLFALLTAKGILYNGIRGPQFCALPLDLQLRLLLWLRENANTLKLLSSDISNMLSAVYECYISSGSGGLSVCATIRELLHGFGHPHLPPTSTLFPHMEAFTTALQTDLSTKLAAAVPLISGASNYGSALQEFKLHKMDEGKRTSIPGKSRETYMDITAYTGPLSLRLDEEVDLDMDLAQENLLEEQQIVPTEASLFDDSQTALLPSSQMDTMHATIGIETIAFEETPMEPTLDEDDRIKVGLLSDKLEGLDGNLNSQSTITYTDISVLLDVAAPAAACDALQVDKLSDEAIGALLSTLLAQDASFARISILLGAFLQKRVSSLEKAASRSLLSALNSAAQVQPRALLEAVLIPVILQSTFSSSQVELILRIMKGLDHSLQDTYAESLILAPRTWNLHHLDLLAKLLPTRSPWPLHVIVKIIDQVHIHVHDPYEGTKANDKIVALVWTIVQKYPAKDLAPCKETLTSIVNRFSTTLSEKALAKIQTF